MLVLAVLVAACAFVILRTGSFTLGPQSNPTSVTPYPEPAGESTENVQDEPDAAPTPLPTPAPTPAPVPYPEDKLSAVSDVNIPEAKLDSPMKAMIEYAEPSPGDNNTVVVISGWAFLPGKDAASTVTYVVLTSVVDGDSAAYQARVADNGRDIAEMFIDDKGTNLDQARFECAIDISGLPDDYYSVSLLLENDKTREHMAIVEPPVDFDIRGGAAT